MSNNDPNHPLVVLLIEDDEPCLRSVTALLELILGYKVIGAPDGESAIKAFGENHAKVSIVILDVVLPGLSGVETFRALRNICPTIPIVITTGHDQGFVESEFAGLSFNGYLQKPVQIDLLNETLQELAEKPSVGSDRAESNQRIS